MEERSSVQTKPDSAVQSINQESSSADIPPKPQGKSKKWLLIILILFLLIALIGLGIYFVIQNNPGKQPVLEEPVVSPISSASISTTPSPTAKTILMFESAETTNWQIYTNAEYGFNFKYPNDYKLDDKLLRVLKDSDKSLLGLYIMKSKYQLAQYPIINLAIVETQKTPQEFLNFDYQRELISWQSIKEDRGIDYPKPIIVSTVNVQSPTITALKVERERIPNAPESKQTQYIFRKDNLLYLFYVNYGTFNPDTGEDGSDEKNALDIMFPTFKFIDNTDIDSGQECIDSNEQCKGKPDGTSCTSGVWCDEEGKICGGLSCAGLGTGICNDNMCVANPPTN